MLAKSPIDSRAWIVVLVCLPLLLGSCTFFKKPPVVLKMANLPMEGNICSIAVLPFTNQTDYELADIIFNRVFISALLEDGNYLVSQEGDVRKILNQMRVIPGIELSSEQIRALADRLGVQIVIAGAVLEMRDKTEFERRLDPSLAIVLRIMEASSGRTIWVTYNRSEGREYRKVMHFGVINSAAALAKKVSAEILKIWKKEGLKECAK